MRTQKGTGYVIALFLAFSLLCSVSLVAQDKLLTNRPSVNNNVADPVAVDCWQYAADGTTCIAGQYFRSDNTVPSTTWTPTATATNYGAWKVGPTGTSSSGCISCHHGSVNGLESNGMSAGGAYLIGGHKNILRKVTPGTPMLNSEGVQVSTVVDHNSGTYTMDVNGLLSGVTGTVGSGRQAWYLAGWMEDPDVFGDFGQSVSGIPYGSCGRCHTTGYRFDDNGPEPSLYNAAGADFDAKYPKLTTTQFPRTPHGGKGTASSWYLTGIQCERCHKADMQYDPAIGSYNKGTGAAPIPTPTLGRVNHLVSQYVDISKVDTANCAWNAARGRSDCPTFGAEIGDFTIPTVAGVGATSTNLIGNGTFTGRPLPKTPGALVCAECHNQYATWSASTNGQNGEVHLTPLPGFEDLVPAVTPGLTPNKTLGGQFAATFACSIGTITTKTNPTNYYDACITAGGKVTYTPGGMSHGIVTTILNSPHAKVTGYVDTKSPASADPSLTIKAGTLANGTKVKGQFNTHFYSEGGVQGSCMGCHDIHGYMEGYVPTGATNVKETLKNCTSCHADHGKSMAHPTGAGTPFVDGKFGSQESCNTCHFAKKTGTEYHFLRINADPNYRMFPDAGTYYKTYGSGNYGKLNTYDSGETYVDADGNTKPYPAVGLDVDFACGQCHVGGDGQKNPYNLTVYAGDGGVKPAPYSREFLAAKAVAMHSTTPDTPTLSIPLPAFGGPATITISSNDMSEGAKIALFYTLDGTTPTVKVGPDYVTYIPANASTIACAGNPCDVTINTTKTLYAIAAGPKTYNFGVSAAVGGTYGVQVAPTPTIVPTGANLVYPQTISVSIRNNSGATVYYTTDGSTPTASSTQYTAPFVVSQSRTIKAIAIGAGYGNSSVATGVFTVKPPTPTWSNVGAKYPGTYIGAVTAKLNDAAPGASICYTTNGTTPALVLGVCNGTTVAPGTAIAVGTSQTIKAIAFDGTAVSSMTSGTFVIK